MSKLNFLHLSDLHYTSEAIQDSKIILEKLWLDIELIKKEKGPIDFIIFSGDLVKKGENIEEFNKAKEYFIKPLLEKTELTYNELFIVLGNHDIDKSKVNDLFEKAITECLNNRENLNLFIDDINKASNFIHLERVFNFYNFSQSISSKFKISFNELYATYIFEKAGIKIGIACLNSSWRATGKNEDFDYGKLLVSERQIDNATKDIKDCDIKIAVFHHPLDWLKPYDHKDIKKRLISDYNILCIGHSHTPEVEIVDIIEDKLILSHAGCLYQGRNFYNGYLLLSHNTVDSTMSVFLRSYFDNRRVFDSGLDRIKDGEMVFNIGHSFNKKNQNIVSFSDLNKITQKIVQYTNQSLLSASGDSFAPKELIKIFVPPNMYKNKLDEYKKDINALTPINQIEQKTEIPISLILEGDENYVIYGKKESGKTTLLNYLCYSMLDKDDLSKIKLPVYIEYNRIKSSKTGLVKSIKNFLGFIDYDFKKEEVEKKLEDGRFLILIDDIVFENDHIFKNLNEFLKKYPKNKYIFTSTENINSKLDIEGIKVDNDDNISKLEIPIEKLFINSFDRKKTRQLITNWFQNVQVDVELILNNILNHISKTNIPRTPTVISLLLWIYEKQTNFVPINKAALIEKFIEVLLEKLNLYESSYKDFDYKDKEHYLSYIAKRMVEENQYAFERIKLEEETIKFLTHKRGIRVNAVSEFVSYFINKGIFVEFGTIIAFKYKCFCEYFIAKRMMFEKEFYDNIINEEKYLSFENEIDYLTGLQRNNRELLVIIRERLDKEFQTLSIDLPLKVFNDVKINNSFIYDRNCQKSKDELKSTLRESKLDDNTRDSLLNYTYPENVKDGKQIERYHYIEKERDIYFIKSLEIFSKITRNSDQIEDLALWKECLKKSIYYWAKIVLYFLCFFESMIENAKIEVITNIPQEKLDLDEEKIRALIDFFFKTFPLDIISELIHDYLGTKKFELTIEDILDNDELETIEELLYVFLYSDLEISGYIQRIESFIDKNLDNEYILGLIYEKLKYYYFLRKIGNIEKINIENLISELHINLSNKTLKGSARKKLKENIGKHFRELKNKEAPQKILCKS